MAGGWSAFQHRDFVFSAFDWQAEESIELAVATSVITAPPTTRVIPEPPEPALVPEAALKKEEAILERMRINRERIEKAAKGN